MGGKIKHIFWTSVSARWHAPYAVILRHFGKIIFTTAVLMLMPIFCALFPLLCCGRKLKRVQKHATSYLDARNWRLSQSQLGKIWEEWMTERMKDRVLGFLLLDYWKFQQPRIPHPLFIDGKTPTAYQIKYSMQNFWPMSLCSTDNKGEHRIVEYKL